MTASTVVPVFAPSGDTGGVEVVARLARDALGAGRCTSAATAMSPLHTGVRGILSSRRPAGPWVALTWKAYALAALRHPGSARRGLLLLHGAELTRDGGALGRLREPTLRRASRLLAVSPLAVALLPPDLRRRVELLGPPVPEASTAAVAPSRHRQEPSPRPLRLLTVGRAVPRKGHDLAVAVARELAAERPVRLDVVGPGPDLPRLRGLAAGGPDGLEVYVHGRVEEAAKQQLYADADVLLFLPRHEDGEFEGLGLVVLEAAARGCPAVVLECGGSPFGVAPGRSGLVLPADASPTALAAAVRDVTSWPDARQEAAAFAASFDPQAWCHRLREAVRGRPLAWQWPSRG